MRVLTGRSNGSLTLVKTGAYGIYQFTPEVQAVPIFKEQEYDRLDKCDLGRLRNHRSKQLNGSEP